jgi:hypothetical protein
VVILGVFQDPFGALHDRFHGAFDHAVLHRNLEIRSGEIPFDEMGDRVGRGVGGIGRGDGEGHRRVHDGDLRKEVRIHESVLLHRLFVRDHHAAVHFRARRGQGEDREHRQRGLDLLFPGEEVPHVPFCHGSRGDGLALVEYAPAADGEDEIDLLLLRELDPRLRVRENRVRLDPAVLDDPELLFEERSFDRIVEPALLDARLPVQE